MQCVSPLPARTPAVSGPISLFVHESKTPLNNQLPRIVLTGHKGPIPPYILHDDSESYPHRRPGAMLIKSSALQRTGSVKSVCELRKQQELGEGISPAGTNPSTPCFASGDASQPYFTHVSTSAVPKLRVGEEESGLSLPRFSTLNETSTHTQPNLHPLVCSSPLSPFPPNRGATQSLRMEKKKEEKKRDEHVRYLTLRSTHMYNRYWQDPWISRYQVKLEISRPSQEVS
ncbi:hypothetical protein B0T19DRAFT_412743 [Cercophora scortea]|uniref:Uncharacterized protein n=1 Tax=Cercophora scortea TaxID=314031 RepID=A0AAE0J6L2_9PEZI|nr:hypothetical protein B0T19DRAFT_412743 [Cercophora scortea]